MKISIIAAIGPNRELGRDNKLLWQIPEDMKRFRQLTQGHAVIMGRKTFESIGKSLPNRTNIIISRNPKFNPSGSIFVNSFEEAFKQARKQEKNGEVFIIGGGQIYEQAIGIADKLYLTIVKGSYQADTFFPDYSAFKKTNFQEKHHNQNYTFTFIELKRK